MALAFVATSEAPPEITKENGWGFTCNTPSGKKEYYNKELDQVATVGRYHINIYFGRIVFNKSRYPFPCDFSKYYIFDI